MLPSPAPASHAADDVIYAKHVAAREYGSLDTPHFAAAEIYRGHAGDARCLDCVAAAARGASRSVILFNITTNMPQHYAASMTTGWLERAAI